VFDVTAQAQRRHQDILDGRPALDRGKAQVRYIENNSRRLA